MILAVPWASTPTSGRQHYQVPRPEPFLFVAPIVPYYCHGDGTLCRIFPPSFLFLLLSSRLKPTVVDVLEAPSE